MDLNNVNLDAKTVNIAEYSQTAAALALLGERYAVVPDASTEEGYGQLKVGIKELTGLRSAIEKARKREKEPHLEASKLIDAEAKRITAEIETIEQPLRDAKTAQDALEAKRKAERIARLQSKVDAIRALATDAQGKTSSEISDLIDRCGEIDVEHDFYDLTDEARKAQAETMDALGRLLSERLVYESTEAERQQLAAANQQKDDEMAAMRRRMAELEQQNAQLVAAQPAAQEAPAAEPAGTWQATVHDKLALIRAVAAGTASPALLQVNTALLQELAAEQAGTLNIPGVTVRHHQAAA